MLVVCRSIIKLLRTLPSPTIALVLIMLSATFVAVPAFNRVDPARISGPTGSVINRSRSVAGLGDPGRALDVGEIALFIGPQSTPTATAAGLQVSKIVFVPNDFALASAPRTKGVRP